MYGAIRRARSVRLRAGRGSKPISVPAALPGTAITIAERRVIIRISLRCDANDRPAAVVDHTGFCSRCSPVGANSRTVEPFIRGQRDPISRAGAWCCWCNGSVGRLSNGGGIGRIKHRRRQRCRRRHITRLRLCMFDQNAGAKRDRAWAKQKPRECCAHDHASSV